MDIKFNKIDKLILLGGWFSMDEFIRYVKKETDFKLVIFSCPRHLGEVINGLTLREILKRNKIIYYESTDINQDKNLKKEITENTLGIGMGASWIFGKRTVGLFAKDHLLDFMNIDLPRYRGGAHHTWRILNRNNIGCLNLQIIHGGKETFHQGELVYSERFLFPKNLRRADDSINFQLRKELAFLKEFLKKIKKGGKFRVVTLNEKESTYFPFLSTKDNGLINWGWSAQNIYLFINAFDGPYPGASTYLSGKRVYLKDCHLLKAKGQYHPFTSGIVARKDGRGIFVTATGALLNIKKAVDEKGADFMNFIKPGDRLHTPFAELDKALGFDAVYTAQGLKNSQKL